MLERIERAIAALDEAVVILAEEKEGARSAELFDKLASTASLLESVRRSLLFNIDDQRMEELNFNHDRYYPPFSEQDESNGLD